MVVEIATEYPTDQIVGEDAESGRGPYALLRIDIEVRNVLLVHGIRQDFRQPVPADRLCAGTAGGYPKLLSAAEEPPGDRPGRRAVQRVEQTQRWAAASDVDKDENPGQIGQRRGRVQDHGGRLVGVEGTLARRRISQFLAERDNRLLGLATNSFGVGGVGKCENSRPAVRPGSAKPKDAHAQQG